MIDFIEYVVTELKSRRLSKENAINLIRQFSRNGGTALCVLPGVAYLEMARAALADAMPAMGPADLVVLDDVLWLKPVVVSEPCDVFIALAAASLDARAAEFEIFSVQDGEEVVHCRGNAAYAAAEAGQRLDLDVLERRAGGGRLDAGAVYPAYRRMGMQFGPAHQALTMVLRGEREVVADQVQVGNIDLVVAVSVPGLVGR